MQPTRGWSAPWLEKLINQVLQLDPSVADKLKPIAGKTILVELTDLKLSFLLMPEANRIGVSTTPSEASEQTKPDVTMQGTSFAFFGMSMSERGGDALFKGEIHFSGEVSTAQQFQAIWKELDIDWEEHLSKFTGDIVAHHLGNAARNLRAGVEQLFNTGRQNFAEYVSEEAKVTPTKVEVELFYDQLDDLVSDLNRLDARVQRIEHQSTIDEEPSS